MEGREGGREGGRNTSRKKVLGELINKCCENFMS
jgi:hypothetical protein